MTSSATDSAHVIAAGLATLPLEKQITTETKEAFPTTGEVHVQHNGEDIIIPTHEELDTLRRVPAPIPWIAFTIAFVELCERFAYYGTTAVMVNYIQQPMPAGSVTGNDPFPDGQPGAIGYGQRASTGLVLFNKFWSYFLPLFGGNYRAHLSHNFDW
jgi:POT family proton-dependent oligopeptide transporter